MAEVQRLLDAGLPPTAHALSGLVYRQVVEMLQGVRGEAATRELDRAREHPLREAAVDLVSQRA